jgi:predicted 3-demethylubiquinone-9 3-methyltransferase (glyoxalase superfamily)
MPRPTSFTFHSLDGFFLVRCETQDEVDHFWTRLGESGKEKQCGWLEDRFGLSWQIVPSPRWR